MTMTLIPPTLEHMGVTLFGPEWREPLASALGVDLEVVFAWDEDPTTIPANLEDGLKMIGEVRLKEIKFMLGQMAETRLDRSIPDDDGEEE